MKNTVCIIGAGLAGLVTAKVLKNDGFDVTVFDKESTIGGVWAPSRAYVGLSTNNPREHYAFSDYSYAQSCDEFPSAAQVLRYLQNYARKFGLEPHFSLSTEVVSVSRRTADDKESHPGFDVLVRPAGESTEVQTHMFDYIVMCNGVFSKPNIPQLEGQELFDGSLIHSSEMVDRAMLHGKRVVVVGAGKSALDCATVAANEADSCTLIFRQPHWMFPRYFSGGKRVDEVFFTRISEKILPAYYKVSRKEQIIRSLATPLLWILRRVMSRNVVRACNIPPDMVPKKPVTTAAENLGIGTRFYEVYHDVKAQIRRTEVKSFSGERTLDLGTGERIEADLVIFATGWKQDVSILDLALRQKIRRNETFYLYRHILPPAEHRLVFNGYASAGNQALTSEITAHWISDCFSKVLELPEVSIMENNISKRQNWTSQVLPGRDEGYFIGGYIYAYIDELLEDMGLPTRRADGLIAEYFEPVDVGRYKGLGVERRNLRDIQESS